MTDIGTILQTNGWAVAIATALTILAVGALKTFHVFDKIDQKARKPLYQVLNLVFAAIFAVAANAIMKRPWNQQFAGFALSVAAAVNVVYPLYENLGLRDIVKKLGAILINAAANDKIKSIINTTLLKNESILTTKAPQQTDAVEKSVDAKKLDAKISEKSTVVATEVPKTMKDTATDQMLDQAKKLLEQLKGDR